ncbi:unnamed protein product [Symbiodinium sp. CCMP2592]|nr:unnamed protein product [Symbiodinium sp. CCMP2592]
MVPDNAESATVVGRRRLAPELSVESVDVSVNLDADESLKVPSSDESFRDWEVPDEHGFALVAVTESDSGVDDCPEGPSDAESVRDAASDTASDRVSPSASVAAFLQAMQPTRPEVLRGCPAHVASADFGRVFWTGGRDSFFHLSIVTEAYDEFVSHSWQVATWRKCLLLVMLKRGAPAFLIAGLGAGLMISIWQFGFLPGYVKAEYESDAPGLQHSFWCLVTGLVLAPLTLLFWRPRGIIFLDRVCINQFDSRQKVEGILNLGAILKASESLLLVWDESYVDRLWCVFELAAFLRSHPDMLTTMNLSKLKVVPAALGYVSLTTALTSLTFGFSGLMVPSGNVWLEWSIKTLLICFFASFIVDTFRAHFRALDAMSTQLQNFELRKTSCWCCSVNHVHPTTSERLPCDRSTINKCLITWFGSEQAFNEAVRSSVATALEQQLGYDAFPYTWWLLSTSPYLWSLMDDLASLVGSSALREDAIQRLLVRYPIYWLFTYPTMFTWAMIFARCLRAKGRNRKAEFLRNALVTAMTTPSILLFVFWEIWTRIAFQRFVGSVIFVTSAVVSFLVSRLFYHWQHGKGILQPNGSRS